MWLLACAFAIGLTVASGQPAPQVYRVGKDVKPPSVVRKPEPTYSEEARAAQVSGEVWLEAIIDENGEPRDIIVVSPLGYGLDEQAANAIATWKFRPATKDKMPVRVRATIAVTFHYRPGGMDKKAEDQRGLYNLALFQLRSGEAGRKKQALENLAVLAKDKFPPAMYAYAVFLREGVEVAADAGRAQELVRAAAEKKYGPAMYEVGVDLLRGRGTPAKPEDARALILASANLGSTAAQFFLGQAFETGVEGYDRSEPNARQFFRLCAAMGQGPCQYRLARLLLNSPARRDTDFTQAVAWLELADQRKVNGARELLDVYRPGLNKEQLEDVNAWITKLVHKN